VIENRIVPATRDLGDGFRVRRALPARERRAVGPFVFFDQFGPVDLAPGQGLDVRPHPHIGLATVTYLFEGELLHRDSLGSVQPIRPGEVNWMVAGRGIVHSERTPQGLRATGSRLAGIQTWVGLPAAAEEAEPSFTHHARLPQWEDDGVTVRVILGDLYGLGSPVATLSSTFYADVTLDAARRLALPAGPDERGVYVVQGAIEAGGERHEAGVMLTFAVGAEAAIASASGARCMIFGGAALDAPRHLWWNFVSSRPERIVQAADDWSAGRFAPVPGEGESIPLPAGGPAALRRP
jgi:redox-sensitive bicupin YhaK (pirin superfamily)